SKFSARGGSISLTVEGPAPGRADILIRVKDGGVGIAPENLARIFNLFTQVDSSLNRATGGLGIGLSLVRHLVALHAGSVDAYSGGLAQGSEFVVRLPSALAPVRAGARDAPLASPPGEPASSRILVTDDNADAAETLAMVLRQAGHEVRIAHSGPETIRLAAEFRPDVVFMDIAMPGVDGLETARQLRRTPGLEDIPLIALTGYGQPSDRERAQKAGLDDLLVKPASPEAVAAVIARVRRRDSARRQA